MNNKLIFAMGLLAGIAAGSGFTYWFLNKKYEEKLENEIADFKDHYNEWDACDEVIEKEAPRLETGLKTKLNEQKKDDILEYARKIKKVGYDQFSSGNEDVNEGELDPHPYPINGEKFVNECREYEKVTVTYYEGDQKLVDEDEELLGIRSTIGLDVLETFGSEENPENEVDVAYARNDETQTDYEIILEHRCLVSPMVDEED